MKNFLSPGYEVWEDWRRYLLGVWENFLWTEEEVTRYLPEKLCGWALDALNFLLIEFWKPIVSTVFEVFKKFLYFFDLRMSEFPKMYEDAFERYLIEKEEYDEAVLQCEIDRPVFESDVC